MQRTMVSCLLVTVLLSLAGCQPLGWIANGVMPPPTEKIAPQYSGLANKSVAVLVAADERTLYLYPGAPLAVGQSVSSQLAASVPGVRIADPHKMQQFQENNPYWSTLPNGDLLKRLGTERLVIIDISEYSTHEPGNAHEWQGRVSANVGVAAADAANPNDFAFSAPVHVEYPENNHGIGVLKSDDESMQTVMLKNFSRDVVRMFTGYERER